MKAVNYQLCKNCHWFLLKSKSTGAYCLVEHVEVIYEGESKPPKRCPYRAMTLEEALTEQVLERLV